MANPMETIRQGLAKTKTVNKAAKNNFAEAVGSTVFDEPGNEEMPNISRGRHQARYTGRDPLSDSDTGIGLTKYAKKKNDPTLDDVGKRTIKTATSRLKSFPKGILPAIGAASSIADAASEIDNIRKGKSDILERTGIYKRPKEL